MLGEIIEKLSVEQKNNVEKHVQCIKTKFSTLITHFSENKSDLQ